VGISALYCRHPSNEELLRQLNLDSPADYIADIEAVLAEHGDPWRSSAHRPPTRSVSQRIGGFWRSLPHQDIKEEVPELQAA
jgi:hypothetical protein